MGNIFLPNRLSCLELIGLAAILGSLHAQKASPDSYHQIDWWAPANPQMTNYKWFYITCLTLANEFAGGHKHNVFKNIINEISLYGVIYVHVFWLR